MDHARQVHGIRGPSEYDREQAAVEKDEVPAKHWLREHPGRVAKAHWHTQDAPLAATFGTGQVPPDALVDVQQWHARVTTDVRDRQEWYDMVANLQASSHGMPGRPSSSLARWDTDAGPGTHDMISSSSTVRLAAACAQAPESDCDSRILVGCAGPRACYDQGTSLQVGNELTVGQAARHRGRQAPAQAQGWNSYWQEMPRIDEGTEGSEGWKMEC
ncbi:hypothetical protein N9L68_05105 [bacterium]|nr:hypothetical protein [bacterium]